jgi:hypothetical protein
MERSPTIRTLSTKEINRRVGRILVMAIKASERYREAIRQTNHKEDGHANRQEDER